MSKSLEPSPIETSAEKSFFQEDSDQIFSQHMEDKKEKYQLWDSNKYYLSSIRAIPLLSREKEVELGKRIEKGNDIEARNALVEHNLRLVLWVIGRMPYAHATIDNADSIQAGNEGLIHAAHKFNYRRSRFSTYAIWWIRNKIYAAREIQGFMIVQPPYILKLKKRVLEASERIANETGAIPSIKDIVKLTQIGHSNVILCLSLFRPAVISLHTAVRSHEKSNGKENALELYHSAPDNSILNPEQRLMAKQALREATANIRTILTLVKSFKKISTRDQALFLLLYGFDRNGEKRTLEETSRHFKITRERARQIVKRTWGEISTHNNKMNHERLLHEFEQIEKLKMLLENE